MKDFYFYVLHSDLYTIASALNKTGHFQILLKKMYFRNAYASFSPNEKLIDKGRERVMGLRLLSDRYSKWPAYLDGPFTDNSEADQWYMPSVMRGGAIY